MLVKKTQLQNDKIALQIQISQFNPNDREKVVRARKHFLCKRCCRGIPRGADYYRLFLPNNFGFHKTAVAVCMDCYKECLSK